MNFQFALDSIFPEDLMLVGRDMTPKTVDGSLNSSTPSDYYRRNFCKLDPSSRLALGEVLDRMGAASARAQGLSQVITTLEKLRTSENHIVYIITRKHPDRTLEGADVCVGFLKVGRKRLFILDSAGGQNEVLPVSVLDFYVHESLQRHGYGRQLFDAMLQTERVEPVHLAIDRPSDKLTSFLAKHYDLRQPCPQMNNFVVYPGFFSDREGDAMFRVHPAITVSPWSTAGRRSCSSYLEAGAASPAPALRSLPSGGRRRLVISRPPPADPRLARSAAQRDTAPPPALPQRSSPVPSADLTHRTLTSPVRTGPGRPWPAQVTAAGGGVPLSETPPVTTRVEPLRSVTHPAWWPVKGREALPGIDRTRTTNGCDVADPCPRNAVASLASGDDSVRDSHPVTSPNSSLSVKVLPDPVVRGIDAVNRSEVTLPVISSHRAAPTHTLGGLPSCSSPKTSAQSESLLPNVSFAKSLPKPHGSFPCERLSAPSPQRGGTIHYTDHWRSSRKLHVSSPLPTSRRRLAPDRLPACSPPVPPACGPPGPPSSRTLAAPPSSGPTSASYPYPWLLSKDELFYPNKRRSPLKNGYEVTSMVGVNGSPAYSRHSHGGSAAGPCRAGGREVRNLHDHHQLW